MSKKKPNGEYVDFDDPTLSQMQRFARALGLQLIIGLTTDNPEENTVMLKRDIARICHEANRALQTIQLKTTPGIAISPTWDACNDEMKESIISGVEGIIGGKNPEESHQSWIDFKEKNGWTYGPVKDEIGKTHPNLIEYDKLPPGQQLKDHLFSAIVHACIGHAS